ncbi:hypothetical protein [Halonotius sp. GCM10025705]|uniref:hypothetical protein n=1 Tax=Halonotius sp. GCM10025705 TaxID=3252678 RepID=UPI00360BE28D
MEPTETPPEDPAAASDALAAHLTATAERPIPPATNRWLGEAEAVARDAASDDIDPATRRQRVQQVAALLAEADATGDEIADEHIADARACCRVLLDK